MSVYVALLVQKGTLALNGEFWGSPASRDCFGMLFKIGFSSISLFSLVVACRFARIWSFPFAAVDQQ